MDESAKKNLNTGPLLSGVLTFYNRELDKNFKILTTTDNSTKLNNVARTACTEIGFKGVSSFIPTIMELNLMENLNVANSSFFGIECDGTEKSVKECRFENNASVNQLFYQLYVECYGTAKIFFY